jgi:thiol:disulfide interchange protein DsbD
LLETTAASDTLALRVDLTETNAEREQVLSDYGGAALPFAVVLDGQSRVVKRFTGMFSAENLVEALNRASEDET